LQRKLVLDMLNSTDRRSEFHPPPVLVCTSRGMS